jgi:hypothetical protein
MKHKLLILKLAALPISDFTVDLLQRLTLSEYGTTFQNRESFPNLLNK